MTIAVCSWEVTIILGLALLGKEPPNRKSHIHALTHEQVAMSEVSNKPDSQEVFDRLSRDDLLKLKGSWEMKVDSKSGWKGTIYLYIIVGTTGKRENFGSLVYDVDVWRPDKGLRVFNTPGGGVPFAAVKRGNVAALVADEKRSRQPFELKLKPELMAPFVLNENMLMLDISKSLKYFVSERIAELDLEWGKLEWKRSDKKRTGKPKTMP